MQEDKLDCAGLGCLLRHTCKRYKRMTLKVIYERKMWMIEQYSPSHGCPNYEATKIEPVIKPTRC